MRLCRCIVPRTSVPIALTGGSARLTWGIIAIRQGAAYERAKPGKGCSVSSSGVKSAFQGGVQRTVLLVDDEPTVRKVLQRVLERAGFSVLIAANADEALAIAARFE